MNLSRLPAVAAAVLAAAVCGAAAQSSIGPGNIVGEWRLSQEVLSPTPAPEAGADAGPNPNACAKVVDHKEFSELVEIEDTTVYSVDFDRIVVDGDKCDDPNPATDRLLLIPSQPDITKLTQIPEVSSVDFDALFGGSDFVGDSVKNFIDDDLANNNYLFGLDLSERSCGDFETPANTAYLFFPLENDLTLSESEDIELKGGQDHMISLNEEALCVYSRERPNQIVDAVDDTLDKIQECFPADATVQTEGGAVKRMDDLVIGDRVMVSSGQFSDVFAFTHKLADVESSFVKLVSASGHVLSVTPGHYIYVNGDLVAAHSVKPGDELRLASGASSTVTSVARESLRGLYNPQTLHGDIVVNGVRASTYTTAVEPAFAHLALSAARASYRWLGLTMTFLESGMRQVVNHLPRGTAVQ